MKIYYEKERFVLSQGKIYFELGKDIVTKGSEYVWTCDKGIYGIFENEELIYIGETMRSFEERMKEHNQFMNEGSNVNEMYKYIKNNFQEKKFFMRPLVELGTRVNANRELTQDEVYAIELGFITCFRPRFNRAGKDVWYKLNKI
jgi:hypothetical protein